jgi:hypothetical protein
MAKTVTNTNIVRRRNLDFDTYERADPESFVDWGQAARDITQTFKEIRDDRKSRKDAIEKGYRERQEALNDIEFYDNPTLQQTAIQASQNASEKLANFNDLMKRGQVSVTDYNLFEHNVKTGFELFQKNALAFDAAFQDYAERTKDDTNAEQERYLAETLKGFANLNNSQISFNAETGNAAFLRVEPPFLENGDKNPKAGQPIKGQSMSLQQMAVFLKQKIDKFDVGGSVKKMVGEIGTLVRANLKREGIVTSITDVTVSKAEQELLDPNNTEGQEILKDKAEQMLTNDQDKMDVLSRLARTSDSEFGKTADGVPFRIGSADEYEAYGGPEENNPILVFEQGTDGLAQPKLNDFQKEQAINFGMEEIKTALSSKVSIKAQKIQATSSGGGGDTTPDPYKTYQEFYNVWNAARNLKKGDNSEEGKKQQALLNEKMTSLLTEINPEYYAHYNRDNGRWMVYEKVYDADTKKRKKGIEGRRFIDELPKTIGIKKMHFETDKIKIPITHLHNTIDERRLLR